MEARRAPCAFLLLSAALLAGCTSDRPAKPAAPAAGPSEQRSPEAAAAAALRHLQLLTGSVMYDRVHRGEALEEVTAAGFCEDLPNVLVGYDRVAALLGLQPDGTPTAGALVARSAALGSQVTDWRGQEATVTVWSVGVLGIAAPATPHPVQERWTTEIVEEVWDGSRWRWAGLTHDDGPVPVGGAQLPSPAEALRDLPGGAA